MNNGSAQDLALQLESDSVMLRLCLEMRLVSMTLLTPAHIYCNVDMVR
jgi:hypothetical protein